MKYHIYNFLKLVPQNKVITYKTLANIFWLHPRQVAKILSENQNQDIYPCYKVVNNDGSIWWYNLWVEEKIKRLQKDGLEIKELNIDFTKSKILNFQQIKWQPILFNFFVAFPLEDKEQKKFVDLAKQLQKINNWSFSIQKFSSPHITVRFFWDLTLKDFHKIIYKAFKDISKIKTNLKNQIVKFNQIWNFHQTVWFYKVKSVNIEKELVKFYTQFHEIIWIPREKRPFRPHLTVLRVKDLDKFKDIEKDILLILEKYDFSIRINKIRFYAAVDGVFQVPLIDINL